MTTNADALTRFGQAADAFGKTYAALKAALIKEGVKETEAINEARNAATIAALYGQEDGETCPLCGK